MAIALWAITAAVTSVAAVGAASPHSVLAPVVAATPLVEPERDEHAARVALAAAELANASLPADPAGNPTGVYLVAGADAAAQVRTVRYMVEVEEGLPFRAEDFAADVDRILNDPRGWGKGGTTLRFLRVGGGPVDFRVSLTSPGETDRRCAPLLTLGQVSCFNGYRAVVNADRWRLGAPTYGDDLEGYRTYVVNHEVGHALGYGHERCGAEGYLAPIMVQQTKSLEGCAPNPWPYP
ncbi:MAG: DUF3152 domain-containing protein [Sporichthyaceae bacterium]